MKTYRTRRNRVGSNQHKTRRTGQWKGFVIGYAVAVLVTLCLAQYYKNVGADKAYADTPIISPLPSNPPFVYKAPVEITGSERDEALAIIKKVWRRDWEVGVALASCESGLRVDAVNEHNTNGSIDVGLFQVNSTHGISRENLLNGYANAGFAYALYKEQGTNPWYSSQSCWEVKL